MDQMICALGKEDHGLLLDCRTLETQQIPLPRSSSILILDTGTRRGLHASAYNERRQQCEQAARFFGMKALRDVSLDRFNVEAGLLKDIVRSRARHVITENERTLRAAQAMQAGDPERLGALMDASHESLRAEFEVSSPALDTIVDLARRERGCYGARLTGAGFAGCAIALVEETRADQISESVSTAYRDRTGLEASAYRCRAVRAVEVISR
jgi:galactokinase